MNALTLPGRAAMLAALIPLMLLSCTTPSDSAQDADPNNAAFVTLLGNDTLAVEQFVRTPTRMEADVVLRTPLPPCASIFSRWTKPARYSDSRQRFERLPSLPMLRLSVTRWEPLWAIAWSWSPQRGTKRRPAP